MKRSKRHRIKQELPETSTARGANSKEHDLAYYIHDRVELMHQVFSVLKPKELKAMAPECVRHISISDLQELCMEELLGISSKRLCAILDGASPPSDTESSSESEQLETISLDSISSDEEILSQVSSKKSKKHKHRSKSKPKKRKSKDKDDEDKDQADRSRRAGLTVLELLELQARARAIRAQLQQEQASAVSAGQPSESVTGNSSDDEVEIKEEAAEVVEISSEDEKPNVQELAERMVARKDSAVDATSIPKTVTKKVNDLIITVPKTNTSRKIKLKRNINSNSKTTEQTLEREKTSSKTSVVTVEEISTINPRRQRSEISNENVSSKTVVNAIAKQTPHSITETAKVDLVNTKDKNKSKDKRKKRKRDRQSNKDGSDHDEITLQLSDTEKMDLLEDLEGKKSEKCSDTEDSSSDSSDQESVKANDSDEDKNSRTKNLNAQKTNLDNDIVDVEYSNDIESNGEPNGIENKITNNMLNNEVDSLGNKFLSDLEDQTVFVNKEIIEKDEDSNNAQSNDAMLCSIDKTNVQTLTATCAKSQLTASEKRESDVPNICESDKVCINDISSLTSTAGTTFNIEENIQNEKMTLNKNIVNKEGQTMKVGQEINNERISEEISKDINLTDTLLEPSVSNKKSVGNSELTNMDGVSNTEVNVAIRNDLKEKSEGELSDRDSSEVEASDFKPDVVCISDDEDKKGKKKKKKDKKNKKEKKSKKKKDFRLSADQNFYTEPSKNPRVTLEKEVILISEDTESCNSNTKCSNVSIENVEYPELKELTTITTIESGDLNDVKLNETESLKSNNINTDVDLDDDVYEILELSDDSSCYEVEEISISKEPTAEEIEALSAKLDELERYRMNDSDTREDKESEELDKVSWKDRYLKSTKVKKVLTTANIMNAMRKKNLELKKKLQESKKVNEAEENKTEHSNITTNFEDGSIEQYNTLETSTRYVDPVKEVIENIENSTEIENECGIQTTNDKNAQDKNAKSDKDTVTNEMKKEAKQLLKMYKMLLKYNDMSKQKDPSKKRKKKKKSKDKDKGVTSQVVTSS